MSSKRKSLPTKIPINRTTDDNLNELKTEGKNLQLINHQNHLNQNPHHRNRLHHSHSNQHYTDHQTNHLHHQQKQASQQRQHLFQEQLKSQDHQPLSGEHVFEQNAFIDNNNHQKNNNNLNHKKDNFHSQHKKFSSNQLDEVTSDIDYEDDTEYNSEIDQHHSEEEEDDEPDSELSNHERLNSSRYREMKLTSSNKKLRSDHLMHDSDHFLNKKSKPLNNSKLIVHKNNDQYEADHEDDDDEELNDEEDEDDLKREKKSLNVNKSHSKIADFIEKAISKEKNESDEDKLPQKLTSVSLK